VRNIRGREERTWDQVRTQPAAYLVEIGNSGADAVGTVVFDIQTSGVAKLAEQSALQGWQANGFTCATRPVSGEANAGLRCTGGSLKRGQSINPAIIVGFTGRGFVAIHASVSVRGGTPEEDTGDNGLALNVRIL